jgi:phospholipase C
VERRNLLLAALAVIAGSACEVHSAGLQDIDTIVVIYAENRSFDNLYGSFPGANLTESQNPTSRICLG